MRKIELEPPNTRAWRLWRTACERETRALCESFESVQKRSIKKQLYRRRSITRSFYLNEGPPFYGKCAYCEAPIVAYRRDNIDHFRPKATITDELKQPIPLRDTTGAVRLGPDGQPVMHPGYYWLAYDWQNLLPACAACNLGKHSRFPVNGRHAQRPEEVADEKPLLINPASGRGEDDPDLHLFFDTLAETIVPRTDRGRKCCEVFALNERTQLLDDRKQAVRSVRALLAKIALQPGGDPEAGRELDRIEAGERPFSMAQRAVLAEVRGNWKLKRAAR